MTWSGVTAIVMAAASMSLAARDQRSPGTDSTSRSSSAVTGTAAQPSDPMSGSPPGSTAHQAHAQTVGVADKAAVGTVDDAALTAQVKSALQSEPALRSQAIEVDSRNATVTLTGAVDSAASKARANELAASVNGVVAVVDQLTITAS
jgi:hypothetical protein